MIYPHAHHYYYSLLPQHNQSLASKTKINTFSSSNIRYTIATHCTWWKTSLLLYWYDIHYTILFSPIFFPFNYYLYLTFIKIYKNKVTTYSNINPKASYCYYSITNSNRGRKGNIVSIIHNKQIFFLNNKLLSNYFSFSFSLSIPQYRRYPTTTTTTTNVTYIYCLLRTTGTIDESNPIQSNPMNWVLNDLYHKNQPFS